MCDSMSLKRVRTKMSQVPEQYCGGQTDNAECFPIVPSLAFNNHRVRSKMISRENDHQNQTV